MRDLNPLHTRWARTGARFYFPLLCYFTTLVNVSRSFIRSGFSPAATCGNPCARFTCPTTSMGDRARKSRTSSSGYLLQRILSAASAHQHVLGILPAVYTRYRIQSPESIPLDFSPSFNEGCSRWDLANCHTHSIPTRNRVQRR